MVRRRRENAGDDPIRTVVDVGSSLPLPNSVGLPLTYLSENYRFIDEAEERADAGMHDEKLSPAARRVLERTSTSKLPKYALQAASGVGGGWIGAMAGSTILPVGGTLIGGLVGSGITAHFAGKAYDGAFASSYEENYVNHIARCHCKRHRDHELVTADDIIPIVIGKLSLEKQKKIAEQLEEATGANNVVEALADPESARAARKILRANQSVLRSRSGLDYDPNDMDKPVEEQLAELANHGVDIRLIATDRQAFKNAVIRYYQQREVLDSGVAHEDDIISPQQLPGAPRTNGRHA